MTPCRSAHRHLADANRHPLHIAERRIADVRLQALAALLAVSAGTGFATVAALLSILVRQ